MDRRHSSSSQENFVVLAQWQKDDEDEDGPGDVTFEGWQEKSPAYQQTQNSRGDDSDDMSGTDVYNIFVSQDAGLTRIVRVEEAPDVSHRSGDEHDVASSLLQLSQSTATFQRILPPNDDLSPPSTPSQDSQKVLSPDQNTNSPSSDMFSKLDDSGKKKKGIIISDTRYKYKDDGSRIRVDLSRSPHADDAASPQDSSDLYSIDGGPTQPEVTTRRRTLQPFFTNVSKSTYKIPVVTDTSEAEAVPEPETAKDDSSSYIAEYRHKLYGKAYFTMSPPKRHAADEEHMSQESPADDRNMEITFDEEAPLDLTKPMVAKTAHKSRWQDARVTDSNITGTDILGESYDNSATSSMRDDDHQNQTTYESEYTTTDVTFDKSPEKENDIPNDSDATLTSSLIEISATEKEDVPTESKSAAVADIENLSIHNESNQEETISSLVQDMTETKSKEPDTTEATIASPTQDNNILWSEDIVLQSADSTEAEATTARPAVLQWEPHDDLMDKPSTDEHGAVDVKGSELMEVEVTQEHEEPNVYDDTDLTVYPETNLLEEPTETVVLHTETYEQYRDAVELQSEDSTVSSQLSKDDENIQTSVEIDTQMEPVSETNMVLDRENVVPMTEAKRPKVAGVVKVGSDNTEPPRTEMADEATVCKAKVEMKPIDEFHIPEPEADVQLLDCDKGLTQAHEPVWETPEYGDTVEDGAGSQLRESVKDTDDVITQIEVYKCHSESKRQQVTEAAAAKKSAASVYETAKKQEYVSKIAEVGSSQEQTVCHDEQKNVSAKIHQSKIEEHGPVVVVPEPQAEVDELEESEPQAEEHEQNIKEPDVKANEPQMEEPLDSAHKSQEEDHESEMEICEEKPQVEDPQTKMLEPELENYEQQIQPKVVGHKPQVVDHELQVDQGPLVADHKQQEDDHKLHMLAPYVKDHELQAEEHEQQVEKLHVDDLDPQGKKPQNQSREEEAKEQKAVWPDSDTDKDQVSSVHEPTYMPEQAAPLLAAVNDSPHVNIVADEENEISESILTTDAISTKTDVQMTEENPLLITDVASSANSTPSPASPTATGSSLMETITQSEVAHLDIEAVAEKEVPTANISLPSIAQVPVTGKESPMTEISSPSIVHPPAEEKETPAARLNLPYIVPVPVTGKESPTTEISSPSIVHPPATGKEAPTAEISSPSTVQPPATGKESPTTEISSPSIVHPPATGKESPTTEISSPSIVQPPATGKEAPTEKEAPTAEIRSPSIIHTPATEKESHTTEISSPTIVHPPQMIKSHPASDYVPDISAQMDNTKHVIRDLHEAQPKSPSAGAQAQPMLQQFDGKDVQLPEIEAKIDSRLILSYPETYRSKVSEYSQNQPVIHQYQALPEVHLSRVPEEHMSGVTQVYADQHVQEPIAEKAEAEPAPAYPTDILQSAMEGANISPDDAFQPEVSPQTSIQYHSQMSYMPSVTPDNERIGYYQHYPQQNVGHLEMYPQQQPRHPQHRPMMIRQPVPLPAHHSVQQMYVQRHHYPDVHGRSHYSDIHTPGAPQYHQYGDQALQSAYQTAPVRRHQLPSHMVTHHMRPVAGSHPQAYTPSRPQNVTSRFPQLSSALSSGRIHVQEHIQAASVPEVIPVTTSYMPEQYSPPVSRMQVYSSVAQPVPELRMMPATSAMELQHSSGGHMTYSQVSVAISQAPYTQPSHSSQLHIPIPQRPYVSPSSPHMGPASPHMAPNSPHLTSPNQSASSMVEHPGLQTVMQSQSPLYIPVTQENAYAQSTQTTAYSMTAVSQRGSVTSQFSASNQGDATSYGSGPDTPVLQIPSPKADLEDQQCRPTQIMPENLQVLPERNSETVTNTTEAGHHRQMSSHQGNKEGKIYHMPAMTDFEFSKFVQPKNKRRTSPVSSPALSSNKPPSQSSMDVESPLSPFVRPSSYEQQSVMFSNESGSASQNQTDFTPPTSVQTEEVEKEPQRLSDYYDVHTPCLDERTYPEDTEASPRNVCKPTRSSPDLSDAAEQRKPTCGITAEQKETATEKPKTDNELSDMCNKDIFDVVIETDSGEDGIYVAPYKANEYDVPRTPPAPALEEPDSIISPRHSSIESPEEKSSQVTLNETSSLQDIQNNSPKLDHPIEESTDKNICPKSVERAEKVISNDKGSPASEDAEVSKSEDPVRGETENETKIHSEKSAEESEARDTKKSAYASETYSEAVGLSFDSEIKASYIEKSSAKYTESQENREAAVGADGTDAVKSDKKADENEKESYQQPQDTDVDTPQLDDLPETEEIVQTIVNIAKSNMMLAGGITQPYAVSEKTKDTDQKQEKRQQIRVEAEKLTTSSTSESAESRNDQKESCKTTEPVPNDNSCCEDKESDTNEVSTADEEKSELSLEEDIEDISQLSKQEAAEENSGVSSQEAAEEKSGASSQEIVQQKSEVASQEAAKQKSEVSQDGTMEKSEVSSQAEHQIKESEGDEQVREHSGESTEKADAGQQESLPEIEEKQCNKREYDELVQEDEEISNKIDTAIIKKADIQERQPGLEASGDDTDGEQVKSAFMQSLNLRTGVESKTKIADYREKSADSETALTDIDTNKQLNESPKRKRKTKSLESENIFSDLPRERRNRTVKDYKLLLTLGKNYLELQTDKSKTEEGSPTKCQSFKLSELLPLPSRFNPVVTLVDCNSLMAFYNDDSRTSSSSHHTVDDTPEETLVEKPTHSSKRGNWKEMERAKERLQRNGRSHEKSEEHTTDDIPSKKEAQLPKKRDVYELTDDDSLDAPDAGKGIAARLRRRLHKNFDQDQKEYEQYNITQQEGSKLTFRRNTRTSIESSSDTQENAKEPVKRYTRTSIENASKSARSAAENPKTPKESVKRKTRSSVESASESIEVIKEQGRTHEDSKVNSDDTHGSQSEQERLQLLTDDVTDAQPLSRGRRLKRGRGRGRGRTRSSKLIDTSVLQDTVSPSFSEDAMQHPSDTIQNYQSEEQEIHRSDPDEYRESRPHGKKEMPDAAECGTCTNDTPQLIAVHKLHSQHDANLESIAEHEVIESDNTKYTEMKPHMTTKTKLLSYPVVKELPENEHGNSSNEKDGLIGEKGQTIDEMYDRDKVEHTEKSKACAIDAIEMKEVGHSEYAHPGPNDKVSTEFKVLSAQPMKSKTKNTALTGRQQTKKAVASAVKHQGHLIKISKGRSGPYFSKKKTIFTAKQRLTQKAYAKGTQRLSRHKFTKLKSKQIKVKRSKEKEQDLQTKGNEKGKPVLLPFQNDYPGPISFSAELLQNIEEVNQMPITIDFDLISSSLTAKVRHDDDLPMLSPPGDPISHGPNEIPTLSPVSREKYGKRKGKPPRGGYLAPYRSEKVKAGEVPPKMPKRRGRPPKYLAEKKVPIKQVLTYYQAKRYVSTTPWTTTHIKIVEKDQKANILPCTVDICKIELKGKSITIKLPCPIIKARQIGRVKRLIRDLNLDILLDSDVRGHIPIKKKRPYRRRNPNLPPIKGTKKSKQNHSKGMTRQTEPREKSDVVESLLADGVAHKNGNMSVEDEVPDKQDTSVDTDGVPVQTKVTKQSCKPQKPEIPVKKQIVADAKMSAQPPVLQPVSRDDAFKRPAPVPAKSLPKSVTHPKPNAMEQLTAAGISPAAIPREALGVTKTITILKEVKEQRPALPEQAEELRADTPAEAAMSEVVSSETGEKKKIFTGKTRTFGMPRTHWPLAKRASRTPPNYTPQGLYHYMYQKTKPVSSAMISYSRGPYVSPRHTYDFNVTKDTSSVYCPMASEYDFDESDETKKSPVAREISDQPQNEPQLSWDTPLLVGERPRVERSPSVSPVTKIIPPRRPSSSSSTSPAGRPIVWPPPEANLISVYDMMMEKKSILEGKKDDGKKDRIENAESEKISEEKNTDAEAEFTSEQNTAAGLELITERARRDDDREPHEGDNINTENENTKVQPQKPILKRKEITPQERNVFEKFMLLRADKSPPSKEKKVKIMLPEMGSDPAASKVVEGSFIKKAKFLVSGKVAKTTASAAEGSVPIVETTTPTAETVVPTAETTVTSAESTAETSTLAAEAVTPKAVTTTPAAVKTLPAAKSNAPDAEKPLPAAKSNAPDAEKPLPAAKSNAPTAETTADVKTEKEGHKDLIELEMPVLEKEPAPGDFVVPAEPQETKPRRGRRPGRPRGSRSHRCTPEPPSRDHYFELFSTEYENQPRPYEDMIWSEVKSTSAAIASVRKEEAKTSPVAVVKEKTDEDTGDSDDSKGKKKFRTYSKRDRLEQRPNFWFQDDTANDVIEDEESNEEGESLKLLSFSRYDDEESNDQHDSESDSEDLPRKRCRISPDKAAKVRRCDSETVAIWNEIVKKPTMQNNNTQYTEVKASTSKVELEPEDHQNRVKRHSDDEGSLQDVMSPAASKRRRYSEEAFADVESEDSTQQSDDRLTIDEAQTSEVKKWTNVSRLNERVRALREVMQVQEEEIQKLRRERQTESSQAESEVAAIFSAVEPQPSTSHTDTSNTPESQRYLNDSPFLQDYYNTHQDESSSHHEDDPADRPSDGDDDLRPDEMLPFDTIEPSLSPTLQENIKHTEKHIEQEATDEFLCNTELFTMEDCPEQKDSVAQQGATSVQKDISIETECSVKEQEAEQEESSSGQEASQDLLEKAELEHAPRVENTKREIAPSVEETIAETSSSLQESHQQETTMNLEQQNPGAS